MSVSLVTMISQLPTGIENTNLDGDRISIKSDWNSHHALLLRRSYGKYWNFDT